MIDNIKIVCPMESQPKESISMTRDSFLFNGLVFNPKFFDNGTVQAYTSKLDNLYLKMRGDTMTISNSIHKYYKGNNYTDFAYTDLVDSFYSLESDLNLPIIEKGKILKLEVGCNILPEENELDYWVTFKNEMPITRTNKSKVISKTFEKTQYAVKGYDKFYESGEIAEAKGLLRFEAVLHRMNAFNLSNKDKPIETVTDLLNPCKLTRLTDWTIQLYKLIQMDNINLEALDSEQIKTYLIMTNPRVREIYARKFESGFKKQKSNFKKIQQTCLSSDSSKLIESKYQNLMES